MSAVMHAPMAFSPMVTGLPGTHDTLGNDVTIGEQDASVDQQGPASANQVGGRPPCVVIDDSPARLPRDRMQRALGSPLQRKN